MEAHRSKTPTAPPGNPDSLSGTGWGRRPYPKKLTRLGLNLEKTERIFTFFPTTVMEAREADLNQWREINYISSELCCAKFLNHRIYCIARLPTLKAGSRRTLFQIPTPEKRTLKVDVGMFVIRSWWSTCCSVLKSLIGKRIHRVFEPHLWLLI